MNIPFVIQTIHERRRGLDLISKHYEQATQFAAPKSRSRDRAGRKSGEGSGITR